MWKKLKSLLPRIVLFLLLVCACCFSSVGYTMMPAETSQSITIPIQTWQTLKSEFNLLNKELTECQNELKLLKKPSNQLVEELAQAQASLIKLSKELDEQKKDLNLLSKEVKESKALLQTLKSQIEKERKIHKRQVWQNRFWCILIGAGIGFVAGR